VEVEDKGRMGFLQGFGLISMTLCSKLEAREDLEAPQCTLLIKETPTWHCQGTE